MKPGASVVSAVVAQDEMFPDGDSGWMEMDEVRHFLNSDFDRFNFAYF